MRHQTMALVRSGQYRRAFHNFVDDLLAHLFNWLLSKHSVQCVVAQQLGNGPLCSVLRDAVAHHYDTHKPDIDADDIYNLEDQIEKVIRGMDVEDIRSFERSVKDVIASEMENIEIEADQIKDLTTAINDTFASDKELQDEVLDAIGQRLLTKVS